MNDAFLKVKPTESLSKNRTKHFSTELVREKLELRIANMSLYLTRDQKFMVHYKNVSFINGPLLI